MLRPVTALFCALSISACGGLEGDVSPDTNLSVRATGGACSNCVGKLDITQYNPGMGDLVRESDSTYNSWGSGSVKLECDDGTDIDIVGLGLEPYDLESGIDLSDVTLPDVDLQASGLECEIHVDDGSQSSVIDVVLI